MVNQAIMPREFDIESLRIEQGNIKGILISVASKSKCPLCQQESRRIQSQYLRTVAELPWSGVAVEFSLQVRRFYCDNSKCIRKIFNERLPELVRAYGRKTFRLEKILKVIAYAEGGESGARTAKEIGIKVSADTLLNHIRKNATKKAAKVRVLGVDEWAKRKGQRYGTILVDMEKRQIIELLEDRQAETFAKWLKEHPEVEIISRDRGQFYAQGAKLGAPNAIEIADRFHLLQNITQLIQRVFLANYQALSLTAKQLSLEQNQQNEIIKQVEVLSLEENEQSEPIKEAIISSIQVMVTKTKNQKVIKPKTCRETKQDALSRVSREGKLSRYNKVIELASKSVSFRKIAYLTGLSRNTVRKYVSLPEMPEMAKTKRSSKLDPYIEYIKQRFQEGCTNSVSLLEEIKRLGFTGSLEIMRRAMRAWRKGAGEIEKKSKIIEVPSIRKLSFVLLDLIKDKDKIRDKDKFSELERFADRLCKVSTTINQAKELAKEFIQIIRERKAQDLDNWVSKAINSRIRELKNFAVFLLRDLAAVRNALIFHWSNGLVEAQVNRLKTIKRQMYGRANLDLLKARLLSLN